MQTGEIKVIEDPPSDVLITWEPDSEVSVSTYNGKGEIRIGGTSVSGLLFGIFDELYGKEFQNILNNPKYGGIISDMREASKFNSYYFSLLKEAWDGKKTDQDLECSFDMCGIPDSFDREERGAYRCYIPSGNRNPSAHISKNGKLNLCQTGFDYFEGDGYESSIMKTAKKPNIVKLDHDNLIYLLMGDDGLFEIGGYKDIIHIIEEVNGGEFLQHLENKPPNNNHLNAGW